MPERCLLRFSSDISLMRIIERIRTVAKTIITISSAPSFFSDSIRKNLFRLVRAQAAPLRFNYTFCGTYVFNYRLSTGKLISTFCKLTTRRPEATRIRNIDGATRINGLDDYLTRTIAISH